ncbi:uncharacterized protein MYCFIDRAFT_46706 [Pseudocercospora fijiensis CIRAD86]|uniref:Uncharacterized protein n=1 Tax=Pseudocercospora fijiensis (strain CIRAD86) TaxID=383855 RepID=M3B7H2_PSEFD|nr:uncharacterized protein MYCFIDRAFT_46706 [Pseudocercospora fijiensis CIRAD86]EME85247.1 hypothetical protein MYCFIDRAFT_46706 [Pseudocercospora fijiensis CIRAD86]
MTSIALPGQSLGPNTSNNLGEATHIHKNNLCASIAGPIHSKPSTSKTSKAPTLSIHRTTGPLLPSVGTKILGRITKTQTRQANISILTIISSSPDETTTTHHNLNDPLPATIRQQDIRATEIDQVKVSESFRVGDIVRAVVISLGDERAYYLSTAKNELGVVMATSEFGNPMVPVSWREFEDLGMGRREVRKVAKPV